MFGTPSTVKRGKILFRHDLLLRLLGVAASQGLLTGQIVFSAAFVGACELLYWIHSPRQLNACLER